jgi:predicted Rossmann fold nucleotide-binding protein DprA/Smf involved in DNA uptake
LDARKHEGDIRPPGRKQLLNDEQRLNWLRLIRSENVGPTTFRELINHFGGSAAALDALPQLSASGGARGRIKVCSLENAPDSPIKLDVDQSDRERVIDALGVSPVDVDEIIRATRLPTRQVQIILLELDLAGRLERHGSQLVSLIDPAEK